MSKRSTMDALINSLNQIDGNPLDEATISTLQTALASRFHLVVSKATKIVAQKEWHEGLPELLTAFERLSKNGAESDPGCIGKTEIIKAISHLNARECDLFTQGICFRQFEPVWGGKEDRAASLRSASAVAMAKHGCRGALIHIAELLADPDIEARAGAALALSGIADEAAIGLLRLRALSSEDEPRVFQEIFSSLLSLTPEPDEQEANDETVQFIARFLNSNSNDIISVATIALGASRRVSAFNALRDFAEVNFDETKKRMAFEAIAIIRLPEAFDYIIDMIQRGSQTEAKLAEEAISIYRGDTRLWARVESAKSGKKGEFDDFLESLF